MRAIALILATVATAVAAENPQALFKELTTPGTSAMRRDELVAKLSACTFSEIGTQVVQIVSQNPGGYATRTNKPWFEEKCPEPLKIFFAAGAVWGAITSVEAGSLSEPLSKLCLEDRPAAERMTYLSQLLYCHYDKRAQAAMECLAGDKTQPAEVAAAAAEILMRKVDPNAYLRNFIEACDRMKDALPRSERFRNGIERLEFSNQSKKMIINYGFAQLTKIDDGKSGKGYFLAMDLGRLIGIKPIREGASPFVPDQRLPKYQGEHGLADSFFQDTVNNAQEWWRTNKKDYVQ